MRKVFLTLCAVVCTVAAFSASAADPYPSKPIRLIVPFTPGTGIDNLARAVGAEMTKQWGVAVVVENRTGVAGNLGAKLVALAPPDGYTLLVTSTNLTIDANMFPDKDFSAQKDLAPLSIGAWGNSTLVARPGLNINTLPELIAYAKANPDKLTFASSGVGSPMHAQLEEFQVATGTHFRHIPYKGTAPAVVDLMGGQVDLAFLASHTIAPNVQSGKLKAIAVGAPARHRMLPNVPSFGELGLTGVSTSMWYGFLAPKGTPPAIIDKLNAEIVAILAIPDVKQTLEKTGLDVKPTSPEEMGKELNKEYAEFGALVTKTGMRTEE
jgi:tripartite-type tricarboxylate transporter receptor subunit TctC